MPIWGADVDLSPDADLSESIIYNESILMSTLLL
jgi:hypothetical protein